MLINFTTRARIFDVVSLTFQTSNWMCRRAGGSTLALELEHSVASRSRLAVRLRRFVAAVHVVRYAAGPQTWRQMSRWAMQTLSWFHEFTQITNSLIFFTNKFFESFQLRSNFNYNCTQNLAVSFIYRAWQKREREMKYKNGPDEAEKLQCVWCWCCCFVHVF